MDVFGYWLGWLSIADREATRFFRVKTMESISTNVVFISAVDFLLITQYQTRSM
jgi:hypothetical protein